jgi:phytoene desaturase
MRVVVVGAGVGGLACAVWARRAGHDVLVLEQGGAPGGKAGRLELCSTGPSAATRPYRFDTGPSLLTMPWVVREALGDAVELLPVEPVTRYRFADGSGFDMPTGAGAQVEALEAWAPGAGADWARLMGVCAAMWRSSEAVLSGPPPFPPRRDVRLSPLDGLRVRPWHTLRSLIRALVRDERLRMVVERSATYAGADPRRAPAALVLAGYVEHAFGAWHPRGGMYEIVRALAERAGDVRTGVRVTAVLRHGRSVWGVRTDALGDLPADAVVWNGDALALRRALGRPWRAREHSVSGLALMLALRGRAPDLVHHEIRFPPDYDAEFDDLFARRRPARDPTLYVSTSCATDPGEAPADGENAFVLVNAPAGAGADWDAEAERVVDRLGVRDRVAAMAVRSPADLERETGAVGGAIYGAAPHGRLGTLRVPAQRVGGIRGLFRVGGTAHPGGGLPLVMLGGRQVARELGGEP